MTTTSVPRLLSGSSKYGCPLLRCSVRSLRGVNSCLYERQREHRLRTMSVHKYLHTSSNRKVQGVCHLSSRGVVRLSGKDTADFLQGLITNDINLLIEKSPSVQYSMMLNVQGRVLYDLFLYNVSEDQSPVTVLVDVDSSVKQEFMSTLKKYKIRKKVDISDVSDHFKVWSQIENNENANWNKALSSRLCFHDPRVPLFARRILTDQGSAEHDQDESLEERDYRICRYKLGIPEGVGDLPPGNCFPLESNATFMNAVNFQKGCYIGQELTARTFYTGVTRKRLVPLTFTDSCPTIASNATITTAKGKNAGKFRNSEGSFGLALLRLAYMKDSLSISSSDGSSTSVSAHAPPWWPANALSTETNS